jgi:hypothetical protein
LFDILRAGDTLVVRWVEHRNRYPAMARPGATRWHGREQAAATARPGARAPRAAMLPHRRAPLRILAAEFRLPCDSPTRGYTLRQGALRGVTMPFKARLFGSCRHSTNDLREPNHCRCS